jgi:hypothetical protein
MQLFECPKIPGKLTLSEASCANYYLSAQKKEWGYRLPHCVECQLGAKNAGVEVGPPFQRRAVCVRCGSGAGRMVLGRLCMSCYNREREWRLGRNAKGGTPREYRALGRFLFTCMADGRRYLIEASCAVEARLAAQKVWGLADLVLDPRKSLLANQITIFEEGRVTHAQTPCRGATPNHILVDGTKDSASRSQGSRCAV